MLAWLKKQLSLGETSKLVTSGAEGRSIASAELLAASARHKEQGDRFSKEGKWDEAAQCYQQAIAIHAQDAEAHNKLGDIFYERRALPLAEASYRQALEIRPDFADARINLGLSLDEQGRFAEAEACYRRIIESKPDDALVHFNLGITLASQHRLPEAEACYRRAVEIKPNFSMAYFRLGVILRQQERLTDAESCQRRALEIRPVYAEAHDELLNTFMGQARFSEAEVICRKMLEHTPNEAVAHYNLGVTLKEQDRSVEAEECYLCALKIKPDFAEAHSNLGVVVMKQGRLSEAEASYRRALEIKPDSAEIHFILGGILADQNRFSEAETALRRALEIKPEFTEACYNLANVLKEQGRLSEAEVCYRRALKSKPDFAEAHNSLGAIFIGQSRFSEAETCFLRALKITPDCSDAHINLGTALHWQGRLIEAEACYRRALKIKPDCVDAHNNLGLALKNQGKLAEAEASYRHVLKLKPDYAEAYSNLLFCLSHNEAVDAQALFVMHCQFGEQYETPLRTSWQQHRNARDPERRLQIGFVSADLHNHAITSFFKPLLACLARSPALSLHAYYNYTVEDDVTRHLRGHMEQWHSIVGLSDAAVAQKICEDGIDILIDLSGHTGKNRLLSFAHKPAPVQASWMGYPGTTGLTAMDYYLADRFLLPPGQFDAQFTEKIVRLPANAVFLPQGAAPPVNILPAIANGHLTFGSFNRPSKLSLKVIALWSQLLRALPDARMLLGAMPEDDNNDTLIGWFAQEGIARERLSFHHRSGMQTYLALHHRVDVCLDTFPYAGGTTTLHALWMGVPTLTFARHTMASRQGVAILGHIGLEEFAARDAADFVQKGLFIAGNIPLLANLRSGLRKRFEQSLISQPAVVADGLERALRMMWQRWCAGLPAESFEVSLQDTGNVTQEAPND